MTKQEKQAQVEEEQKKRERYESYLRTTSPESRENFKKLLKEGNIEKLVDYFKKFYDGWETEMIRKCLPAFIDAELNPDGWWED